MPAVRRTPFMKLFWRVHRSVFRATGGRIGARVGPLSVLLLSVRGRKSGVARDVLLNHMRDGINYVVFASHAGEEREPPWWLNLRDAGEGEVMVGGERFPVRPVTSTIASLLKSGQAIGSGPPQRRGPASGGPSPGISGESPV